MFSKQNSATGHSVGSKRVPHTSVQFTSFLCIPVRCVPSACCPYRGEGLHPEGLHPGVCLGEEGLHYGGLPNPFKVYQIGGGQTSLPLWTEGMTQAFENITLPKTSFAGGNNLKSWIRHWGT